MMTPSVRKKKYFYYITGKQGFGPPEGVKFKAIVSKMLCPNFVQYLPSSGIFRETMEA